METDIVEQQHGNEDLMTFDSDSEQSDKEVYMPEKYHVCQTNSLLSMDKSIDDDDNMNDDQVQDFVEPEREKLADMDFSAIKTTQTLDNQFSKQKTILRRNSSLAQRQKPKKIICRHSFHEDYSNFDADEPANEKNNNSLNMNENDIDAENKEESLMRPHISNLAQKESLHLMMSELHRKLQKGQVLRQKSSSGNDSEILSCGGLADGDSGITYHEADQPVLDIHNTDCSLMTKEEKDLDNKTTLELSAVLKDTTLEKNLISVKTERDKVLDMKPVKTGSSNNEIFSAELRERELLVREDQAKIVSQLHDDAFDNDKLKSTELSSDKIEHAKKADVARTGVENYQTMSPPDKNYTQIISVNMLEKVSSAVQITADNKTNNSQISLKSGSLKFQPTSDSQQQPIWISQSRLRNSTQNSVPIRKSMHESQTEIPEWIKKASNRQKKSVLMINKAESPIREEKRHEDGKNVSWLKEFQNSHKRLKYSNAAEISKDDREELSSNSNNSNIHLNQKSKTSNETDYNVKCHIGSESKIQLDTVTAKGETGSNVVCNRIEKKTATSIKMEKPILDTISDGLIFEERNTKNKLLDEAVILTNMKENRFLRQSQTSNQYVPSWKKITNEGTGSSKIHLSSAEVDTTDIPDWKKQLAVRNRAKREAIKNTDSISTASSDCNIPPWKQELAQRKRTSSFIERAGNSRTTANKMIPEWLKQAQERKTVSTKSFLDH